MSNFERDMANTMLDAADARIASLEADKADLLRVLGVADEKIRSGEDARGQYIRENAALEARCRELEAALAEVGRTCNGEAGCKGYKYANGKLPPTSETHPESGTPRGEAGDRAGPLVSPHSAKETACECNTLDARGTAGDLEMYCRDCGKVFRAASDTVNRSVK